jgi:hydroxypyruvate reductase
VYIVELGAGSGKLGYLVVEGLLRYRAFFPPFPESAGLPFRYVLTDISQRTIDGWLAHPCLREFLDLGVLDVGHKGLHIVDLAPGISLPMLQALTHRLLACGADITAINTVRRRIDRVKGGGLARAGAHTTLRTLILSDVIGNSLTAIASGPTVPNPDDADAARQVLVTAGIDQQVDPAILAACATPITRQPVAHTPTIIADISQSLAAASAAARAAGYAPTLVSAALAGDALHAGASIAALLRALPPSRQPRCLLWGGETTVSLVPQHGHGGRNQTVALAIAQGIAGGTDALVAAYATDGGDGPTDAAGAVVTATTWQRAHDSGLDPAQHLSQHNAYPLFAALGDLLLPGPTGTNVNDVVVALIENDE